jgi:cyclopropane fatty-acyl-phospholipid synthase-like methyltransferase
VPEFPTPRGRRRAQLRRRHQQPGGRHGARRYAPTPEAPPTGDEAGDVVGSGANTRTTVNVALLARVAAGILQRGVMSSDAVNLYDNVYADFASRAELAVRQETYGEDLGQSSWLTAREWLEYADQLGIGPGTEVLEVGSGSGGPAVYLAAKRGCRVTGVDVNEHGVRNARALADARGLSEQVHFEAVDASQPLPFAGACFDVIVSNDAMCHIASRAAVLRDWYRLVRPGGRALFTDAMVLTGPVSHEEIATRSSIGFYVFVPPGANEAMLQQAGFAVRAVRDVTDCAAEVASRWHDARARHRGALVAREGEANFEGLQRFLRCVHVLSVERRLSRYAYLAEKPASAS